MNKFRISHVIAYVVGTRVGPWWEPGTWPGVARITDAAYVVNVNRNTLTHDKTTSVDLQ